MSTLNLSGIRRILYLFVFQQCAECIQRQLIRHVLWNAQEKTRSQLQVIIY